MMLFVVSAGSVPRERMTTRVLPPTVHPAYETKRSEAKGRYIFGFRRIRGFAYLGRLSFASAFNMNVC